MGRIKLDQDMLLRFGLHGQRFWQRAPRCRVVPYCCECHARHKFEESCPHTFDKEPWVQNRLVKVRTWYWQGGYSEDTPEATMEIKRFTFVKYLVRRRILKK